MGNKSSNFKLSRTDMDDIKQRFSDKEIEEWYEEFKQRGGGKDYLTEKDFLAVYSKVFPGDCTDYVRHLFRTFDTNGNGKVDFREFMIGLHVSGSTDVDKGLRWAFDVYDVSNNNEISKPEMAEIVRSVYKMLDYRTVKLPPEYETPELVVDQMFQAMDKNHDECLTWEEFRDGVMKDPFLLNLLQCSPPSQGGEDSDRFNPH